MSTEQTLSNPDFSNNSLSDHVTQMLEVYFNTLEEQHACDVYEMVLQQVEKPMIEFVLEQTQNNQSQAANILGMNRNTLKKNPGGNDELKAI